MRTLLCASILVVLTTANAQIGRENSIFAELASDEMANPIYTELPCNVGVRRSLRITWSEYFGTLTSNSDVEIPCGRLVVLDKDAVVPRLGNLHIRGALIVALDRPPSTIEIQNILIEGFLIAGLPSNYLRNRIVFKFVNERYRSLELVRDGQSLNFGTKAAAVVGGQVSIYGMPGGRRCLDLSWVRLAVRANIGDVRVQLDANVEGCWRSGHQIGFSPSFVRRGREERTIVRVTGSTITLDEPLQFDHFGSSDSIRIGGRNVEYTSEVGLLTRNVVFDGATETTYGNHFIVAHTSSAQEMYGVEFVRGGQPGYLGRYPLHFHMCDQTRQVVVKSCSFHSSFQRGLIVHGTDNLLIMQNVAFNIVGHIFGTEDGIERNNSFHGNLAVSADRPSIVITIDGKPETDNQFSGFWMKAPGNSLSGNVAAGANFGFWYDLDDKVRGPSASYPQAGEVNPQETRVILFDRNIAHSGFTGLSLYPHGMTPKGQGNAFTNFFTYINQNRGIFAHNSANFIISNAIVADSNLSVDLDRVRDAIFADSLIVGKSDIYDTCPSLYGLELHPIRDIYNTENPTLVENVVFSKFQGCPLAPISIGNELATIQGDNNRQQSLPASNTLRNITFTDKPAQVIFIPRSERNIEGSLPSEWYRHVALQIFDSPAISGRRDGFLLSANNPGLLPTKTRCLTREGIDAYLCSSVCYRTLSIKLLLTQLSRRPPWSLKLTRVSDNTEDFLRIPHISTFQGKTSYTFFTNVLADEQYLVETLKSGGGGQTSGWQVSYDDGKDMVCKGTVDLLFSEVEYSLSPTVGGQPAFQLPCPGSTTAVKAGEVLYESQCLQRRPVFRVQLQQTFNSPGMVLGLRASYGARRNCDVRGVGTCRAFERETEWRVFDEGREPRGFQAASFDVSEWKTGRGVFGYNLMGFPGFILINYMLNRQNTAVYFRKEFNLAQAACYRLNRMNPRVLADDGFVLYLNGVEVERRNMPAGDITFSTLATRPDTSREYMDIKSTGPDVRFRNGMNVIAIEVHREESAARSIGNADLRFDMFLDLIYSADCLKT